MTVPPDLPELYVIRHGETEWNRIGRWQGALDSPLTDRGAAQARDMARALSHLGITSVSHALHHSPQGRATATAAAIASVTGQTMIPVDALREIGVGDWAGLTVEDVDARWPAPDPHEHFLDRYARAPNGEGFDALWDRVAAYLATLDRPTVIVTHGITSRVLRTIATGRTPAALAELPGGQGVLFRLSEGRHDRIDPADLPLAPPPASG